MMHAIPVAIVAFKRINRQLSRSCLTLALIGHEQANCSGDIDQELYQISNAYKT